MSSFAQKLFGVGSSASKQQSGKKKIENDRNTPKTRGPLLSVFTMNHVRGGAGTVPIGPKDIISVKNQVCLETVSTPRRNRHNKNGSSTQNPETLRSEEPDENYKTNVMSF